MPIVTKHAFVVVVLALQAPVRANDPNRPTTDQPHQSRQALERILEKQAGGQQIDRRTLRALDLDESIASHVGLIRRGNELVPVEKLRNLDEDKAYEAKRALLVGMPGQHLKLARWCVRNDLHQRARAHYHAVLAVNANHQEARAYLQHVLIGNQWYSRSDIATSRAVAAKTMKGLEEWLPEISKIATAIESSNTRASLKALEELAKINDPSSIPALEFAASRVDSDLAKPLIKKIVQFPSQQACLALTRIALLTSSSDIREMTVRHLREYPEEMYVPELLGMLSGEVEVRTNLIARPNGSLALVALVANELQNEKYVRRFEKLIKVSGFFASSVRSTVIEDQEVHWDADLITHSKITVSANTINEWYVNVPQNVAREAYHNLSEMEHQAARNENVMNRNLTKRRQVVCSLLRSLTQQQLQNDSQEWWKWWDSHYERSERNKRTVRLSAYESNQITVASRNYANSKKSYSRTDRRPGFQYSCSCLVPGTMIQTVSGPMPVELIKIGDLVLSQDVESGELALKPVVLTTVRPPKFTYSIRTDSDKIEATGGHLWWVSGKGWTKTRDLRVGMLLHNATGSSEVTEVSPSSEKSVTHNLVVDRFHTYFVGRDRVLSYDNTLVRPTLRSLPGFSLVANAK